MQKQFGQEAVDQLDWSAPRLLCIAEDFTHHDPLDFRQLPSTTEDLPPYSVCPSPYRWMREENFRQLCEDEHFDIRGPDAPDKQGGWVFEPDRQLALLTHFWGRLEKGRSLVFFYCNQGNPLEENLTRVLIGVGRISNIGPQRFFGKKPPKFPDDYPIWSRCITHDFENQGVRLPYHEYLRDGHECPLRISVQRVDWSSRNRQDQCP